MTKVLNKNLGDLGEDVMGFLNEVQLDYPQAISLASGRPDERFFQLEASIQAYDTFVQYRSINTNKSKQETIGLLGQYGRTKGIINDIIVKFLKEDENIHVNPSSVLLTVGAQEAMALVVTAMCNATDVLLVENPSYIGISSFAKIAGYQVAPVAVDQDGIDTTQLVDQIEALTQEGKRAKLVYVIPDFQNPTGSYMPLNKREELLQLAAKHDFYIIEDNAYGHFIYEGDRIPSLKSLDKNNRVIFIGSFSKLLFPGLRIATLVADQVIQEGEKEIRLSDAFAKVKNYLSVNSASICQAIVGGVLIQHNYTLSRFTQPKLKALKEKRDAIVNALSAHFDIENHAWADQVSWQKPQGGFFITVKLPFEMGKKELLDCVQQHGVICCPMTFFDLEGKPSNQVRFAFSNLTIDQIHEAIQRFAAYVTNQMAVVTT